MDSMNHHILLSLNLAQVEFLSLATQTTLMTTASLDESPVRDRLENVILWLSGITVWVDEGTVCCGSTEHGHLLRSSVHSGSIVSFQAGEGLAFLPFDKGECVCG